MSKLCSVALPYVTVGWSALWYFLIILYAPIKVIPLVEGGGGWTGLSAKLFKSSP